jgi:hypothetical protein
LLTNLCNNVCQITNKIVGQATNNGKKVTYIINCWSGDQQWRKTNEIVGQATNNGESDQQW